MAVAAVCIVLTLTRAEADPPPFTSPQSIGDLVPASINLQVDGQWDTAGVAQANAAVNAAKNQPATFQVQIEFVHPSGSGYGGGYNLSTPDGTIEIHGNTVNYHLGIFTTADQSTAAAQLQPGATVTVSGTIGRSDLNIRSLGRVILNVNLNNCKIVGGTPAAATEPAVPFPGTPATAPAAPPNPVTNSQGVKFVAAGTPGVLFSVWDVRLKDFKAFVAATGFDNRGVIIALQGGVWQKSNNSWLDPGFSQSEDDPVVGVNEGDAIAFCTWLTKKEQADGTLPPNQAYRLPTNAEWAAAAGATLYAWGDAWPPPAGAGNFAGKEARDANWPATDNVLDGYSDDFPHTSPVGRFRPNGYGLYDMGGDVYQMCSLADGSWNLRGGSWESGTQDKLRLSHVAHVSRVTRFTYTGFRIVLAASTGTPSTSTTPSPDSSPFGTPAAPTPPSPAPPTAKLTEDQARAVVLITGDNGEGTRFPDQDRRRSLRGDEPPCHR